MTLPWAKWPYCDLWWRIRCLTPQTHIQSPSLLHFLNAALLDCRAWRRCQYYRSPSFPNSHSGLLLFLRMFVTYDFDPAFILHWGHIVVSYLALARTHVCRSWHFWGRSFLIGRERMRAAEKPRYDEFPADKSCVALITRGASVPRAAVILGRVHGCSAALRVWPWHLLSVRSVRRTLTLISQERVARLTRAGSWMCLNIRPGCESSVIVALLLWAVLVS